MTDINPDNRIGVSANIVGYASSNARTPAYDKSGERGILEVSIPISEGFKNSDGDWVEKSVTWYTYSGAGEFAENVLANVQKGDKIRVTDAKQEVREYKDKNGNDKLGITLRYGSFEVLESKGSSDSGSPF